jgi:ribosomal protein S18 acetylase RimI-like enzyme
MANKIDVALTLQFEVTLRLARREDLPLLEWFGQFTHYRRLYRRTFEDQQHQRRLMLVAECNHFPIGQIFIHLSDAGRPDSSRNYRGYLYSLRVMVPFRGHGIGTELILKAEELLIEQGYNWAVIAVAKDNPGARRLYERLGYAVYGDDPGRWRYMDHKGRIRQVTEPSWMLQKRL